MKPRRVLQVIHGYPPRYNAGSEVYTQTLARGLQQDAALQVSVFARYHEPFQRDFTLRMEQDGEIPVFLVNHARENTRFEHKELDGVFASVLEQVKPDIVHFGHLNHLSTSLVQMSKSYGAGTVFTLHDFWLMCPRGQFLKHTVTGEEDAWKLCEKQCHQECATTCFNRFHSGGPDDVAYWEKWIEKRMLASSAAVQHVDRFISPSRHLRQRFIAWGIPPARIDYLDYGFNLPPGASNNRREEDVLVFGYTGRHHASKGIDMLIRAFGKIRHPSKLRIWGRSESTVTPALKELAQKVVPDYESRIEWLPEYENGRVGEVVFQNCDVLVVPSIWEENSPLVIHEAQHYRIPVITADRGGMAEFVRDGVNGKLFRFRDEEDLVRALSEACQDPVGLQKLGARGYWKSKSGEIPHIREHLQRVQEIYSEVILRKTNSPKARPVMKGPWRITFDTNPDLCNLNCVMCEEHSHFSPLLKDRLEKKTERRTMDISVVERVIEECVPQGLKEIVPSTMGEPLLYKHFDRIIELCQKHNVKMNLTTNGTWPTRGATVWAEALMDVLSDVKISWNGASEEVQRKVMLGSSFKKHLRDLERFLKVREEKGRTKDVSVTLQLTFMEQTMEDIPSLVQLALKLGVNRIKGHHLWAHFSEIKDQDMRRNKESRLRWNQIVAKCVELARGSSLKLENFELLSMGEDEAPELTSDMECPFLGKEAWVNASGRFDPCCAPDAERQSLGTFGNVKDRGLLEVWKSAQYRNLANNYQDHAVCKNCTMRKKLVH